MARFRATIKGETGEATRLGTAKSGMRASITTDHAGVLIIAETLRDGTGNAAGDRFAVFQTAGRFGEALDKHIGTITVDRQGVVKWRGRLAA